MMPRHILQFLGEHGAHSVPEASARLASTHQGVTIFFMDIVGFTAIAEKVRPIS